MAPVTLPPPLQSCAHALGTRGVHVSPRRESGRLLEQAMKVKLTEMCGAGERGQIRHLRGALDATARLRDAAPLCRSDGVAASGRQRLQGRKPAASAAAISS